MSISTEAGQTAVAVAGEIRLYLAARGLSASRAAEQLGWGQRYLSRRLTGEVPFDVNDLAQLSALLNVPVQEFFNIDVRYRGNSLLLFAA